MSDRVLLLNNNYEPLNVCSMVRAVSLMAKGKVEVLHRNGHTIRTATTEFSAPSVIRLRYFVRRPMPQLRLCRQSILARDDYTCQYCGLQSKELTIDHVIPRTLGGKHTWDNVVACCRRCNLKKGDKLPQRAGMKLRRKPRRPHYVPYISLQHYLRGQKNEDWMLYLPVFSDLTPAE
jgi:5-methylcytosine-specific restriction endonuclease McrA